MSEPGHVTGVEDVGRITRTGGKNVGLFALFYGENDPDRHG
jgi:hypothetical protein